jgi:hypothetical protein
MKETLKARCHPSRETFWHFEANHWVEDEWARPSKDTFTHAQ